MTSVAGVDGYRRGWVAIVLVESRFERALVAPSLGTLMEHLGDVVAIGLDMPIGLPDRWPRESDLLARKFIGPRRNSVFMTPPRLIWEAETIEEARRRSLEFTGQSISSQTYALRPRILEADEIARRDRRVHEVHPEVSFADLAGGHLAHPKSTWAGVVLRRRVLDEHGIEIPEELGPAGVAGVDDVLDAAIAAWSAMRIANGNARSLPDPPHVGSDGHASAIWR